MSWIDSYTAAKVRPSLAEEWKTSILFFFACFFEKSADRAPARAAGVTSLCRRHRGSIALPPRAGCPQEQSAGC